MPGIYEFEFLPAGRVERFVDCQRNLYLLADGSQLIIRTRPAWCRRCGRVTHAEQIGPLEAIDQRLAELRDPSSPSYRALAAGAIPGVTPEGDDFVQLVVNDLRIRRRWRAGRESPPRCIFCGTTDIVALPRVGVVADPDGPGTVEGRWIGIGSFDDERKFFTPEGERLPRDRWPRREHDTADDDPPPDALRRAVARFLKGRR